ncbi:NAD(P)-dependent oxidoreductase [Holophaga foetida]|uniref:NAD(P)-dependent oxidoreductase n=1 Tax=Holophaga foetida TaxID=35839 RepID=UPI000247177B|nr:NAD(P)-dependent oxidoreductase [Holophaga foetida]
MIQACFLNAEKLDFHQDLDFSALASLVDYTSFSSSRPDQILERAAGQEVLICKELPLGKALIEGLSDSVKLICEAGTGYNNIDIAAARQRGILVCNVPEYSTEAVAQLAITFILNLSISLPRQLQMLHGQNFDNFTKAVQVPLAELRGKTLGVIGFGAIAQQTARIAQVLGMEILVHTRTPRPEAHPGIGFESLDNVLRTSDYLTLHCPLNGDTRHLINRERLLMMKPTAFLINTSRGGLVLEADLIEALQNCVIAGAGLDVQDPEPPEPDNPLFRMENVLLTPHIGWRRRETRQRLVGKVVETIAAYLQGDPIHGVN